MTLTPDPSRPNGVFEDGDAPQGSWSDFADDLRRTVHEQHGTALRAFVKRLVEARSKDQPELQQRIRSCIMAFRVKCGVDQNDSAALARADTFGIVFAAAWLARRFGVLPGGGRWTPGTAALAAYKAALTHRPASFDELLKALAAHPDTLVFGYNVTPPLTVDQVASGSVFLERTKSGRERLFVRDDRIHDVIQGWATIKRSAAVAARWRPDPDHAHDARQKTLSPGQRAPFRLFQFDLP